MSADKFDWWENTPFQHQPKPKKTMSYYPNLILLNGPPGCGKDAAAKIIKDRGTNVQIVKFANALKSSAQSMIGFNSDPSTMEGCKDDRGGGLMNGHTWREIYIALSEKFMKPMFGDRIFGKLLSQSIGEGHGPAATYAVPDSGFVGEALELLETRDWDGDLLFDQDQVVLIRIERPGHTFDGDSRSYISLRDHGVHVREITIINGGTLLDLEDKLQAALGSAVVKALGYQVQVQIPIGGVGGCPGWAVVTDEKETLDEALAILQAAREATYLNRVTRVVRGKEIIRTVWPEDAPAYDFEQADTRPEIKQAKLTLVRDREDQA